MDDGVIEQFHSDGATVVPGLLDQEWLGLIATGVDHNAGHPSTWSHWDARSEAGDDNTYAERPREVSPHYGPDGLDVGRPLGDDPRFPLVTVD